MCLEVFLVLSIPVRHLPRTKQPDAMFDLLVLLTGLICVVGDAEEVACFFHSDEVAAWTAAAALNTVDLAAQHRSIDTEAEPLYVCIPEDIRDAFWNFAQSGRASVPQGCIVPAQDGAVAVINGTVRSHHGWLHAAMLVCLEAYQALQPTATILALGIKL